MAPFVTLRWNAPFSLNTEHGRQQPDRGWVDRCVGGAGAVVDDVLQSNMQPDIS